jgi:hypothetical protein
LDLLVLFLWKDPLEHHVRLLPCLWVGGVRSAHLWILILPEKGSKKFIHVTFLYCMNRSSSLLWVPLTPGMRRGTNWGKLAPLFTNSFCFINDSFETRFLAEFLWHWCNLVNSSSRQVGVELKSMLEPTSAVIGNLSTFVSAGWELEDQMSYWPQQHNQGRG